MANKFDIHFQTLPIEEQQDSEYVMYFGGQVQGVKGPQMLINQWFKHFLTERGTDYTNLDYGTVFPTLIGSTLTPADARDVVLLSIEQTNNYLYGVQASDPTLTASERLEKAVLVRYTEDTTAPGFTGFIELSNRAGDVVTLPLPVT